MIYLDHNATTPIDERVLEAMLPYQKSYFGNASSLYRQGRLARSAIDRAREQLAALINAPPSKIIFTSGGTEANNLALACADTDVPFAISAIEHPSVYAPALHLRETGRELIIINVDRDGVIAPDELASLPVGKIGFASMMLANNETGVLLNVGRFAGSLRNDNIVVHTDAVQALGKIPVDFNALDVDLMSLSAHKIYGPKGCGALVFDNPGLVRPILRGGGQEQGLRAGTENVSAIVGFGKAAELAHKELEERGKHLMVLRNRLETGLRTIPGLIIFADKADRLPNTVLFGLPGFDGEMMQMELDRKGIAVSSGSACASGGREMSPVLLAMGVEPVLGLSAIRISFGMANTEEEIITFIESLQTLIGKQRG